MTLGGYAARRRWPSCCQAVYGTHCVAQFRQRQSDGPGMCKKHPPPDPCQRCARAGARRVLRRHRPRRGAV